MADDLGTYFLIGPSCAVTAGFLNETTGSTICMGLFNQNNKRILSPGLHFYSFNFLQRKICFLEVHGFNDNEIFLSDSQLLCLLQYMYFQALSKGLRPKGFLVTEARNTNRLAIFSSLDRLFSICGDRCKSSTLVLAKRLHANKELESNNNIITSRCENLGISYVKWTISLQLLTKEEARIQKSSLISALSNMEPYYATWMTELEEEIKTAPKIQIPEQRNITDDRDSDDSEIDDEEKQYKLKSVSQVGLTIYYRNCILTRLGVISASRKAFGLENI